MAPAASLGRKCVLIRWADVTTEMVISLVERGAGSLLLLLPQNFSEVEGERVQVLRKKIRLCFIFSNLEVSYSSVHKHAYATSCMRCHLGGLGIFRSSQIASDAIWDKISFRYRIAYNSVFHPEVFARGGIMVCSKF